MRVNVQELLDAIKLCDVKGVPISTDYLLRSVKALAQERDAAIDDYAHFENSCWHCAMPDSGDPERCTDHEKPEWYHFIDPGDGLSSPCQNAEQLERIFQALLPAAQVTEPIHD